MRKLTPAKILRFGLALLGLLLGMALLGKLGAGERLPPTLSDGAALVATPIPGQAYLAEGGAAAEGGLRAALLPHGPDLQLLPGDAGVWQRLLSVDAAVARQEERDGFDGIQLWNESNRSQRAPVFSVPLPGRPTDVSVQGPLVFLLLSNGKWLLVDFELWRQPKIYNLTPAGAFVSSMAVRGTRAWLMLNSGELLVLDIERPRKPRQLALLRVPERVASLVLQDDLLLLHSWAVSSDRKLLYVYRLGDGEVPVRLGVAAMPSYRAGFLWAQRKAFIPRLEGGVDIYALDDPLQPRLQATIELDDLIERMSLRGDRLLMLGLHKRLYEVDLGAAELNPRPLAQGPAALAPLLINNAYIVAFAPNHSLQVFARAGLAGQRMDGLGAKVYPQGAMLPGDGERRPLLLSERDHVIATPGPKVDPVQRMTLPGGSPVLAAARMADSLLVLRDGGSLQRYAGTAGTDPELIEERQLDAGLRWLVVDRDRVYLGGGDRLILLRSLPDGRLQLAGEIGLGVEATWVAALFEGCLCLAAGRDGLLTFSLTEPERPQRLPDVMMPRAVDDRLDVRDLAVADRTLLAAAGSAGLLLIESAAPEQLVLAGVMASPEPIRAVALRDDFCLAATERSVQVVCLSDRHSLQRLGSVDLAGAVRLTVFDGQWWAGLVPGRGWLGLPMPRVAVVQQDHRADRLRLEFAPPGEPWNFQVVLFNQAGAVDSPGSLEVTAAGAAMGASPP